MVWKAITSIFLDQSFHYKCVIVKLFILLCYISHERIFVLETGLKVKIPKIINNALIVLWWNYLTKAESPHHLENPLSHLCFNLPKMFEHVFNWGNTQPFLLSWHFKRIGPRRQQPLKHNWIVKRLHYDNHWLYCSNLIAVILFSKWRQCVRVPPGIFPQRFSEAL